MLYEINVPCALNLHEWKGKCSFRQEDQKEYLYLFRGKDEISRLLS